MSKSIDMDLEVVQSKLNNGDYVQRPKTHEGGLRRKKPSGMHFQTVSNQMFYAFGKFNKHSIPFRFVEFV